MSRGAPSACPLEIGRSLTTWHHNTTGPWPGAGKTIHRLHIGNGCRKACRPSLSSSIRRLMAHRALMAHTFPRAETKLRGPLVRLVRTFYTRNRTMCWPRVTSLPTASGWPSAHGSLDPPDHHTPQPVRGREFTKFGHLRQTKDLAPAGPIKSAHPGHETRQGYSLA